MSTGKAFQPKIIVDNTQDDSDNYLRPLIPAGVYLLKLQAHSTGLYFGQPRLVLRFSVVDMGEYHGTTVYRYYNVQKLIGKPGVNGRFKPPRSGDFLIEFFQIARDCACPRLDRISLDPLYRKILVGRVRTVGRNNLQKTVPDQLKYSLVAELLRAEE